MRAQGQVTPAPRQFPLSEASTFDRRLKRVETFVPARAGRRTNCERRNLTALVEIERTKPIGPRWPELRNTVDLSVVRCQWSVVKALDILVCAGNTFHSMSNQDSGDQGV